MWEKSVLILCVLWVLPFNCCVLAENANGPTSKAAVNNASDIVTISVERQYKVVQPGSKSALAVHFELEKDWHFYASAETAPGQMNLKFNPSAEDGIIFSQPIFPKSQLYFDKVSNKTLDVFSDKFTVFLPFSVTGSPLDAGRDNTISVKIAIEGAVCSDVQCRMPNFDDLSTEIAIAGNAAMNNPKFVLPALVQAKPESKMTSAERRVNYSALFAFGLAFLAGLTLNIMPCVWPVLPLIVMRIVQQAKHSKGKSIVMGLAFCLGILLFFASLAGANIVLKIVYGTVLEWGDQFRSPVFVTGMAFLLIVLAQFCFGVFTISVPSAIAGKAGAGEGYYGTVGMGFLAAVLSTPCSFGILAAAFAWVQAQPLLPATLAIMAIGVGMALPYAILTSMPGLLQRLPKAGRWMELFKQAMGFVMLVIAVKLISALPDIRKMRVIYFAVVLGFCVWMWGSWISHDTKLLRKWIIRLVAICLAVAAGLVLLSGPPSELVDWQSYDAASIEMAIIEERPLLIKFTADWCLSCQLVDKVVYSKKNIAGLIKEKNVLAIKADTTFKDYPATIALRNVYNEPGVPVSMLFLPGTEQPLKWYSMSFGDELKAALEKLPSP